MLRFDSARRCARARSASRLKPPGRRASSPIDGFAQTDPAGFDSAPPTLTVPSRRRGSRVTAGRRLWLWPPACAGVRSVASSLHPTTPHIPPFLHHKVLHMFRAEVTHGA